ncbi:hypothetical protein QKW60_07650 [Defluviimonas aestuarii]|uniref:hypothetical protein n=1 Tax=Albidovulum aestuarii TaxID=1130726 RepID=UPI00249B95EA|nr:hypothetical protein [Defluviimonas aestuarii]MDI3336276.1 hypothetical protein [Defluviimonas aestuarii]
MRGGTWAFCLSCLAASFVQAGGNAALFEAQQACSAHFEARSDWLAAIEGNETTVAMLAGYSDELLSAAEFWQPGEDWDMVVGAQEAAGHTLAARKRDAAMEIMTDFALRGFSGRDVPLCMEDEDCTRCMGVLKAARE